VPPDRRRPSAWRALEAACLLASALGLGRAGVARGADPDPVPVLPHATVLAPGPRRLGFQGLAADPSSIGDFAGTVALAYLRGRVRDASGRRWLMENDVRVMQGDCVAADGIRRHGTFAFL
jgi:hypothetical protein